MVYNFEYEYIKLDQVRVSLKLPDSNSKIGFIVELSMDKTQNQLHIHQAKVALFRYVSRKYGSIGSSYIPSPSYPIEIFTDECPY